jgi:hypothetical protein
VPVPDPSAAAVAYFRECDLLGTHTAVFEPRIGEE